MIVVCFWISLTRLASASLSPRTSTCIYSTHTELTHTLPKNTEILWCEMWPSKMKWKKAFKEKRRRGAYPPLSPFCRFATLHRYSSSFSLCFASLLSPASVSLSLLSSIKNWFRPGCDEMHCWFFVAEACQKLPLSQSEDSSDLCARKLVLVSFCGLACFIFCHRLASKLFTQRMKLLRRLNKHLIQT